MATLTVGYENEEQLNSDAGDAVVEVIQLSTEIERLFTIWRTLEDPRTTDSVRNDDLRKIHEVLFGNQSKEMDLNYLLNGMPDAGDGFLWINDIYEAAMPPNVGGGRHPMPSAPPEKDVEEGNKPFNEEVNRTSPRDSPRIDALDRPRLAVPRTRVIDGALKTVILQRADSTRVSRMVTKFEESHN